MASMDEAELATDRLLATSARGTDRRAQAITAMRTAIDHARSHWPRVELDPLRFSDHLAARIDHELPVDEAIAALDAAGLWLACACLEGHETAWLAFERAFAGPLARVLDGAIAPGGDGDDIAQQLRARLLGSLDDEPALARYGGRGPLAGWLRVMATRMRIDAQRRHVDGPLPEARTGELACLAEDPELAYLAAHCRVAFAEAIRDAFAGLSARQRTLLRLHLVRGIAATGIAEVYAVHVSSVKRWLADARNELVSRAESELRSRLGADTRELHSVLRVIHSRLELSLRALIEDSRVGPELG
jgi:RNA polymerase sigma-70 factor, ECF subfamily